MDKASPEPLEEILKVGTGNQPEAPDSGDLAMVEGNQYVAPGGIEAEVDGLDVVIGGNDLKDLEGDQIEKEQPTEAVNKQIVSVPDDEEEVSDYANEAQLEKHMELLFGDVQFPPAEFTEAEVDASLRARSRNQDRVPRTPESLQHLADDLVQIKAGDRVEETIQPTPPQLIEDSEHERRERKRKGKGLAKPTLKKQRKPKSTITIREQSPHGATTARQDESEEEEELCWPRNSAKNQKVVTQKDRHLSKG